MADCKCGDQNQYFFPVLQLINRHQGDQKQNMVITFEIGNMFDP